MAYKEDCYFFFNSTCTKGDDCAFRHEPSALGNNAVCDQWRSGTCTRNPCRFRHGMVETPKLNVPCFYETTPTGCLNPSCQFVHCKPRPFMAGFQSSSALPPAPAMVHPRFSNMFAQRFPPQVQNQHFRGPVNHRMDHVARNVPPGHVLRHPQLPPRFTNHPRPPGLPIPGFQNMGPRLYQDQRAAIVRNVLNNSLALGQTSSRPGFRAEMANGRGANGGPTLRPPILANQNRGMLPRHDRLVPNMNIPTNRDGEGVHGGNPFAATLAALGGINPFHLPAAATTFERKSKRRTSESRGSRMSSKRTVKKLDDKRRRRAEKPFKSRDERRMLDSSEERRRKKERIGSKKELRDYSSRLRKVKRSTSPEEPAKQLGDHSPGREQIESMETSEDVKGTTEEAAGLSFKVKTLEEIYRERVLNNLREREEMKKKAAEEEKMVNKSSHVDSTVNEGSSSAVTALQSGVGDKVAERDGAVAGPRGSSTEKNTGNRQKQEQSDLTAIKVKTLEEIRLQKQQAAAADSSSNKDDPPKNDVKSRVLKPLKGRVRKLNSNRSNLGTTSIIGGGDTSGHSDEKKIQSGDGGQGKEISGIPNTSASVIGHIRRTVTVAGTARNDGRNNTSDSTGTFPTDGDSDGAGSHSSKVSRVSQTSNKSSTKPLPPLRKPKSAKIALSPLPAATPASADSTTAQVLKRKLEQQTYRKLVKTSKVRRLLSNSGHHSPLSACTVNNENNSTSSTTDNSPPKTACKVLPILQTGRGIHGRTSFAGTNSDISKRTMLLDNTQVRNDQENQVDRTAQKAKITAKITQSISTTGSTQQPTKDVEIRNLDTSSQGTERSENATIITKEKPVRRLKLKRVHLTGAQGQTQNNGGFQSFVSALGRKIKVKRKTEQQTKGNTEQQSAVEKSNVAKTEQLKVVKPELKKKTFLRKNIEAKPASLIAKLESSSSEKASNNFPPTVVNNLVVVNPFRTKNANPTQRLSKTSDDLEKSVLFTKNPKGSPFVSIMSENVSGTNRDDEGLGSDDRLGLCIEDDMKPAVAARTRGVSLSETQVKNSESTADDQETSSSDIDKSQTSERLGLLKSETSLERKSSLDQLVKEVSDDIRNHEDDEDDDDLDHELAKAIAEMPPPESDDDDLNADDLLLEIAEVVNS